MTKMWRRMLKKVSSKKMNQQENQLPEDNQKEMLLPNLQEMMDYVQQKLGNSNDLIIREMVIQEGKRAALFFTDGMTDMQMVHELVESLVEVKEKSEVFTQNLVEFYKKNHSSIGEVREVKDLDTFFMTILSGDSVFLIDGEQAGISFGTKGWEGRTVDEPTTQTVVRGPKEGFTENLRTNTTLVRRRIKSPNLWIESFVVGKQTKTSIEVMYVKGIVNPKIIKEVQDRINRIDTDAVLESGILEELIEDEPLSPFPTVYATERPDHVAASLLEGRVAIMVDGTPFVLIAPVIFIQFFQVSEDYYDKPHVATFTRFLRFVCVLISLQLLSLYIALVTFHQETIPTPLLNSIAAQREGVPFPAMIEAIILMGSFEILREAGVRMPRVIGPAISIVGGLVLGQAAVEAGFVSTAMVIIVAMTALSDFVIPSVAMADAIKLNRYFLLFVASAFGIYGLGVGLLLIILHLCSLRSFGVPYMSPIGPFIFSEQKDFLTRLPKWAQHTRPSLISKKNPIRERTPAPRPDSQASDHSE